MFVDWNTTTIVLNSDRLILVDSHLNMGAVARHCLVDGVVNGLVDEVMETFLTDVANVHGRTLAHCLKSFEDLDVTCRVVALVFLYFCHYLNFDI